MDLVLNALIFLITVLQFLRLFQMNEGWSTARVKSALRFFTVQSNILCAAAALLMCLAPSCPWVWLLKYIGTAAVTVTMVTVFVFLAPALGSLKRLMQGADFYMHLVTPLLALISFCGLERRGIGFGLALTGMLPTTLYAVLYAYKILLAPPEKSWKDFYGFNRGGKWYLSALAMLAGTFVICVALMALQNLR